MERMTPMSWLESLYFKYLRIGDLRVLFAAECSILMPTIWVAGFQKKKKSVLFYPLGFCESVNDHSVFLAQLLMSCLGSSVGLNH